MSNRLPNRRQHKRRHQGIKHTLQNQRTMLHMIPVDIDTHKTRNRRTHPQRHQPIPLPAPSKRIPPFIQRQIPPSMFAQRSQAAKNGDGEQEGKAHTHGSMLANGVDGCKAGSAVDEGAIAGEHVGLEVLEGEVAIGAIGERAVCVEGVVVVVQGEAVEVYLVDDYICAIGSWLVGCDGPDVEQSHLRILFCLIALLEQLKHKGKVPGGIVMGTYCGL